jgi:hypothetical protein
VSRARRAGNRYTVRLLIALGAYAVLIILALLLFGAVGPASPLRWVAMALPLPALAGVVAAVARYVMEADELQSRIQLQSMSIGFAGGSTITFGYGLMQVVGAPPISWLWVWPVYAACWLIGSLIVRRRY